MIRRLLEWIRFRVLVLRDDLTGRTVHLDGREVPGTDIVGDGFYMLTTGIGRPEDPIPTLRIHRGFSLHANGWRAHATRIVDENPATGGRS